MVLKKNNQELVKLSDRKIIIMKVSLMFLKNMKKKKRL